MVFVYLLVWRIKQLIERAKTLYSCTTVILPLVIFFFFSLQAAAIFNSAFGSFLVSNEVFINA